MPSSSPPAILATGLRKSFGGTTVLDGIDLTVESGTVFALLGPNGAGKTTTVNILSTLLPADGGSASVNGFDLSTAPSAVRRSIGVTGQFSAIDGLLTGAENLELMGNLHHLSKADRRFRAAELLQLFELRHDADRPASTYSGGMKRKLDLAMTLVGRPTVIFLDEPTTGLDPRSRRALWDIVRKMTANGITILLTTQYLDEADQLADRVAVLDHGRIVAAGAPGELKRAVPGGAIVVHLDSQDDLQTATGALPEGVGDASTMTVRIIGSADISTVRGILDRLDRSGISSAQLEVSSPGLDDVFLALTQPTVRKAS